MLHVDGQSIEARHTQTPRGLEPVRLRMGRWSPDPVLVVAGEIDLLTSAALRSALDHLNGSVIVDLYGVSFMDCAGIGVLAAARQRLSANGGDLRLRSPQEQIRRTLHLLGMSDWIIGVRAMPTAGHSLESTQDGKAHSAA
jgi:anti-anti-sigma factor